MSENYSVRNANLASCLQTYIQQLPKKVSLILKKKTNFQYGFKTGKYPQDYNRFPSILKSHVYDRIADNFPRKLKKEVIRLKQNWF